MKVTDAKFVRRFKTEEYSFEEHALSAQVEEGETGAEVLIALKEQVQTAFTGETAAVAEPKQKKEKKKNGTKAKPDHTDDEDTSDEDPADENAGDDGEGDQDDEAADDEVSDNSDDSSEDGEDSESDEADEEEVEEVKPAKSAKGGKDSVKKGFRKKPQVYTRSIDQHKEIFSGVLKSVAPDWKKSEATKAKAKKASEKMEGVEFLDENGEVLESFSAEVKKHMTAKK